MIFEVFLQQKTQKLIGYLPSLNVSKHFGKDAYLGDYAITRELISILHYVRHFAHYNFILHSFFMTIVVVASAVVRFAHNAALAIL